MFRYFKSLLLLLLNLMANKYFFLNLTHMKNARLNILSFCVFLLLASFTVSYAHNIIEQLGEGCEQHEVHDFSKVIINASMRMQTDSDRGISKIDFAIINFDVIPASIQTLFDLSYSSSTLPLIYYDKLFLTKTGSLLI